MKGNEAKARNRKQTERKLKIRTRSKKTENKKKGSYKDRKQNSRTFRIKFR